MADEQVAKKDRSFFTTLAQLISSWSGKPPTFCVALGLIVAWALSGPAFGFSETWQLIVNTSTTIITFLMVFVIQNSQNRDTAAMQIKLDELIARLEGPRGNCSISRSSIRANLSRCGGSFAFALRRPGKSPPA